MDHLTLSFFGTFQALLGDKPLINFRSAKVQGLFIYHALTAPQAHGRDVLAAMFWPDDPESVAKQNLRQSLYRLRGLLSDVDSGAEPYLLVTRSTVQFSPTNKVDLDVARFISHLEKDQLESAVALYQGDLLSGFNCDSPPFDDWLRSEREKLHRLALDALFELTDQSLTRAAYQEAQTLARRQLALEPWREEAHRQLMLALALSGDRSAALAQYNICRAVLADELGVAPSAQIEVLVKRIRDQHPAATAGQKHGRSPEQPQLITPFVGRAREFEALVQAFRKSSLDGVQLVTLVGEAGIGKSRLAQQFQAWAATQGADVLHGHAYETSAGLPYQPITHLLRQRIERENAPEDLLSDLWLSQLTRILPELRERYPDLPEPTVEEATARQHLFEAITRLGQALSERAPLVMLIDDLHWADTASLDMLHYAALRWVEAKAPVLIVLTLRQEALSDSPDLQNWLNRIKRDGASLQFNLAKLSRSETEDLIQALLEPEAGLGESPSSLTQMCRWLFAETEGQPLFLTETLKALVADGLVKPDATAAAWQADWSKLAEQWAGSRVLPGVREIVQSWLDRITAPAGQLLTAASVLAEEGSFDHLCRVAGLDETQALTALDELLSQQLLLEDDVTLSILGRDPVYRFSHQKVSEVVYAEAGAARRRILHRRAFAALQAANVPAAELAHHALNAGLVTQTIQFCLVAGNEAMALFAVRVAIAHYETAWQVSGQKGWPEEISGADRQALYSGLGRAYELVDEWTEAQGLYRSMIDHARTIGAGAMECLGLTRLATVYLNGLGDRPQAFALLEQARSLAEQNGDRRGVAETEWTLSVAAVHEEKPHLALYHGERAVAIARELGHPQLLARSLTSLAQVYALRRQWEIAEAHVAESHHLYVHADNLVLAANSQRGLGFIQMFLGRPTDSLATLQETFAFSRKIENQWGLADCAWIMARIHLELGNYGDAIRLGRQAIEQSRSVGPPVFHTLVRSAWGIVQRTVMDWDAAQKTLLELLVKIPEEGVIGWTDQAPELCALHASVGDWAQATHYAKQVVRSSGDEPLLPFNLTGWYETEALLRGGDSDLARANVERLGMVVGNNRRYRLILHRSHAVLAQWDGDLGRAITHLQAALTLAQEIGLPGEEWSILDALGGLYAAQGGQAAAQQAYRDAAAIVHRLAETIDEEELRTGYLAAVPVRAVLEKNGEGET